VLGLHGRRRQRRGGGSLKFKQKMRFKMFAYLRAFGPTL
jgi:hypothetical protein